MPGFPAARKGDLTVHGGVITGGSPNVTTGGMPQSRLLHPHTCPLPGHVGGPITKTSPTVIVNKFGAARVMDACTCFAPPTPAAEGGAGGKDENGQFKVEFGPNDRKFREREGLGESKTSPLDALKKAKDDYKKKDEPWKPELSVKAGQEWKKGGEYKKLGSEDNNVSFAAREGKASWSAGVDAKDVKNLKAGAGGKVEGEFSAVKAKGKLGDRTKGFGELGGEAKFLTVKADAGAEAKLEMKNGQLETAYVGAGAGAGASVLEGKASGQTRAFKIPFINWGISLGGELSGALLTAEARADYHAGYKDKKWSFGFGAKIGAALAGLGFKFNVTVEKIEPPKPPPKPPGIPGFAGIDPIAMGCFTVLIGDTPKPYVPGPPKKANIPFTDVGDPKNRNLQGPKTPPPPGSPPVRQLSSDLDELYIAAAKAQEELAIMTRSVAAATSGTPVIPDKLKGRERAMQKIAAEYGGDAGLLMDLARSSIEFTKMEDLKRALAMIESSCEVVRKKDRFAKPLPTGYRDILLNVRTSNGHITEMQLHLKQILEAKEGPGHPLYVQMRTIEDEAKAANRPLTAAEAMKVVDLQQQQRQIYDAAFAKAQ